MEAGAQLDQRRDAASTLTSPSVGRVMPATHFSSVLLPEPLLPITP